MTRTLILTRHAKSDHPGRVADHDRGLTDRGREGAAKIGDWLAAEGHLPEAVLCSTATRAVETLDGIAARWDAEVPRRLDRRLYHAPPEAMRHVLSEATAATVMMVGHNPGIAAFAASLVAAAPVHPRFYDYPTCATLVVRFEAQDWGAALRAKGEVAGFAVPADL